MSIDIFDLWLKGLKSGTRTQYGSFLRRLFKIANITPQTVLINAINDSKNNVAITYSNLVALAKANFTPRIAYITVFALRRFLLDNGIMMLPPTRLSTPQKVKQPTGLSWEEANQIGGAASRPYNLILKLMLLCGWGIGEFLKFNTQNTWNDITKYIANNPNAEYYRHDFMGRKRSVTPFYTLIPVPVLKEIINIINIPITATHSFSGKGVNRKGTKKNTQGVTLDTGHYRSSTKYIEHAFKTALKRAPISVRGSPSVHELRDTFRTRASRVDCSPDAAEFAMGHNIDKLGYNKINQDIEWQWSQIKKIYGPSMASMREIEELRAKDIEREGKLSKMEAMLLKIRYQGLDKEKQEEIDRLLRTQPTAEGTVGFGGFAPSTRLTGIEEEMKQIKERLKQLGVNI